MRKLSLLLPIFFLFISCQNTSVDDIDLAEDIPENITSLSQMTSSLLDVYFLSINMYDGQNNKREDEDKDEDKDGKEICFEFVIPVSFNMPDGTVLTIETEDDWKKLERWYRANDNTSEEPEIIFPVQVIYKDETLTINSSEELKDLEEDCKED